MIPIPFHTIDWSNVERTEHPGETGMSSWQTLMFDGLRVRIVEYSAGYTWPTIGARRATLFIALTVSL